MWRPTLVRPVVGATLLALLCLLGACRTEVVVGIDVSADGSGTVTVTAALDAGAVEALGGAANLALDDLAGTRWDVQGPDPAEDGGATVSATTRFGDGDELAEVLSEVAGAAVFSGTSLEVSDGFARTDYELRTTVEVSGEATQFTDAELTGLLGDLPLGRTSEELAAEGVTDPAAGELVVEVSLPGADATEVARVSLTSGEPSSVAVVEESRTTQQQVLVLAGAAVVAAVVGVGLILVDRRRARRRTPDGTTAAGTTAAGTTSSAGTADGQRRTS